MKIIGFAGSLRTGSYNKKALWVALEGAKEAGAEIEEVDLRALDIPAYDEDIEDTKGLPESIKNLKEKIDKADALIVASPEYNNSISGVLKNVIDWVSRKGEEDTTPFKGKPTALLTASTGRYGGLRAALVFRTIARGIGLYLMNEEVQVTNAGDVFDGDEIVNERVEKQLKDLGKNLIVWTDNFRR